VLKHPVHHPFDTSGKTPVEMYHHRNRRARTFTGCGPFFYASLSSDCPGLNSSTSSTQDGDDEEDDAVERGVFGNGRFIAAFDLQGTRKAPWTA
jgi:hypothetical protein